jgi:hypothetical protein
MSINSHKAKITYDSKDFLGARAKDDTQQDQTKFSLFNGVPVAASNTGKQFKKARDLAQAHLSSVDDFMDRLNNPQYDKPMG